MTAPVLDDRELQYLRHLAAGHTRTRTATDMNLSPATVDRIAASVRHKLGANSAPNAIHIAHRRGLLAPPRHGDHIGYRRHQRRGEPACADCLAGEREYSARRRTTDHTQTTRSAA